MARRRRSYRGITSLNLGALPVGLDDSVQVKDVIMGVAVGLVGAAGVKAALNKFAPGIMTKIRDMAGPAIPLITGVAAGAALYYVQKGSSRARGHAVGAAMAGLAVTLMSYLPKLNIPGLDFNEVVSLNLSGLGGYNGLLVNDSSDFNGLLVSDNSDSLNELAAMSMDEDGGGLYAE
jgi:hypothetical protein